jgi:penicillin-binding protein 1A
MKVALANKPPVPFRVPAGIKLVRVDPRTGTRVGPGGPSILEGFKPGTAPPDGYAYVESEGGGYEAPPGYEVRGGRRSWSVGPDDDRAIRRGPGGLY